MKIYLKFPLEKMGNRRGGQEIFTTSTDGHSPRTACKNKKTTEKKSQDPKAQGDMNQETKTALANILIKGQILWHICTNKSIYAIQVCDFLWNLPGLKETLQILFLTIKSIKVGTEKVQKRTIKTNLNEKNIMINMRIKFFKNNILINH